MVTERLQSIFKCPDVIEMHHNEAYHFTIKSLKPKDSNYQILYTDGLSIRLQPVDDKNWKFQHIELYFLLPDYWDLFKESWPVYWLDRIAQVPQKNNTWFGPGDTLPAGNPPEKINEIFECSYFILSEPLLLEELNTNSFEDSSFRMMAVIPIFSKEFEFKSQNSGKALLKILQEKQIFEMVDIYRKPVARRKFMGMF